MTVTPGAPRLAPVGRRVAAFTVDVAVVLAVAAVVLVVTDEPLYAALALGELVVALCVWEARSGTTVGNAVCSVRTARTDGRHAPGIRRVIVRALVVAAGALVAVVGQWVVVASAAWDRGPLRQGWHDAVAGTTMVDVSRRRAGRSARTSPARRAGAQPMVAPVVTAAAPGMTAAPTASGGYSATAVFPTPAPSPAPALPAPAASAPGPAYPAGAHLAPEAPAAPAYGTAAPPVAASAPPVASRPEHRAPEPRPAPPITSVPRTQAPATTAYRLSFDNGQSFLVRGSGLVGRKPQSEPGEQHDDLLAVADDDRSVSKTHLEFGVDAQGFWVSDRGSTNGSAVLAAHGDPLDVLPGMRVHVPAGASVRVGQRQFTATRVDR